jgi:hypothetical protein
MRGLLQLSLPHWSRRILQKRTVLPRERNSNSFRHHSVLFNLLLLFQSVGQARLPMYQKTALTMPFFALRAGTARTAILKRFKIWQENHFQPAAAAAADAASSVRFVVVVLLFFFFLSSYRIHISSCDSYSRLSSAARSAVTYSFRLSVCMFIAGYNRVSLWIIRYKGARYCIMRL